MLHGNGKQIMIQLCIRLVFFEVVSTGKTHTLLGTPEYMAPEMIVWTSDNSVKKKERESEVPFNKASFRGFFTFLFLSI